MKTERWQDFDKEIHARSLRFLVVGELSVCLMGRFNQLKRDIRISKQRGGVRKQILSENKAI